MTAIAGFDAVFSAAKLLCANGAGDPARLPEAIWSYNHSDTYVAQVLQLAASFGVISLQTDVAIASAADLLRINIATGQTNDDSHFPNGRALADDVTDTLLTVACAKPNEAGTGLTPIGDGVNANDKAFTTTFPYLASPHSGNP